MARQEQDLFGAGTFAYEDQSDKVQERRYIDPWPDVTERAKIRIYHNSYGMVTGLMPEIIGGSHSNNYSAPFATILAEFNTGLLAIQEALGREDDVKYSAVFKELTTNIWGGGSELMLRPFKLLYIARKNGRDDVIAPMKMLMKMSAGVLGVKGELSFKGSDRSVSATVLSPPSSVMVEMGNFMRVKTAVITSMSWEVPNVNDSEGVPAWAVVTIALKTKRVFMGDDDEIDLMGTPLRLG
jgi:hypothetical protein